MKNNILTFLLGVFVTISIAATSYELVETRPATPKQVLVINEYYADGAKHEIEKYTKQGWIVKQVSNGGDDAYIIIVLEKY